MTGPSYGGDGQITYDFGQITDVAHAIITYEGAMDGSLAELYNSFKVLFHAPTDGRAWVGKAADACDAAQQAWQKGVDEIKQALGTLGHKLNASVDNMQQLEAQIAAQM